MDALNSISGFRDTLFTNSHLRAVFSGDVVDEKVKLSEVLFLLRPVLPSRFIFKMKTDWVLRSAISLGRKF
jgi:hypothetical protein